MMTSSNQCFVWKWLKGQSEPVVAGRLTIDETGQHFTYGQSYLKRSDAEPIYSNELPLSAGTKEPVQGMPIFSCLRDAAPDAWGRRVINSRLMGKDYDAELGEMTYLMHSASDRIGSLDFQESATEYFDRSTDAATLEELYNASEIVGQGKEISSDLDRALMHGTSLGGARPKAMITGNEAKYIAKFSASNDTYEVVQSEYVAMRLAKLAGLNVAEVIFEKVLGKDVLLVRRFDRALVGDVWCRRSMVSGLTVLGLDETWAREASYADLVNNMKQYCIDFTSDSQELFARMVFNVLIGNTDDHARNHAFFVEGEKISLSPAYDICPQNRTGGEASHGMKIFENLNLSLLSLCMQAAPSFNIKAEKAEEIIRFQISTITQEFESVCNEVDVPEVTRKLLFKRVILNDYIFNEMEHLKPQDGH
ncbi:phosphatidylinositol kinase [Vibrio splendidus]|uniref:HipA domain-containing protein n=2 Tax=Vibrio TaxID=662 RepID=A0AB35N3X6_VIBSP|nr:MULTISPECIES: HipA domain-containing protein [Vibrio]MCC4791116.1 HipA domain-containing protein [Vibrio splendidus]MDP2503710.1 HipA domain-containing protein [Vibrio splendidus]PMJ37415.1 phosphatidylinositol kinase [Vibrio cyclitrophicus]PMM73046.1 phosphatidylinositol kinase [Vibrio splendidus]PMO80149.1 phosphatidylinositol kinase [Vibrio tasmaniensis]